MTTVILETAARAVFQTTLLFSVFLLFAGHNAPGGGFIGGLVAASGFALYYVAYGFDRLRRLVALQPATLLGAGLTMAALTGVLALAAGGAFLQSGFLELDIPVLGHVAVSSVLLFDAGVYAIVVGLALALLETLGGEAER